ncbi:hypothetical protein BDV18DRAFT_160992 [Aspergillus unguis]
MEIKRKPVPAPASDEYGVQRPLTPNPPPYSPYRAYSPFSPSPVSPHPPQLPPRLPSPSPSHTQSLQPPHHLPRYRSQPNLRSPPLSPHPPPIPRADTTFPADPFPDQSSASAELSAQAPTDTKTSSSFSADARYFLSGLIHRPSESTRHYSILRHSHGIVFYRGPSTSVTVSLFSDTPLQTDRRLYLQCKGWSGKTGMRAKALFRMHDDWVDATPTVPARVDQVDPQKERAWQRDFARFYKKASKRVRETHKLRETAVARIPPDAEDGYFQLILCDGKKKVLCRSPVFRILSTSIDPSSLRGASLSTMPLEIGALVAGTYAQIAASKVLAPATAAANAASAKYKPGVVGQAAIRTAYDAVKPDGSRPDMAVAPAIENGPQDPYPLDFSAKPIQSLDQSRMSVKIPSDVQDKLRGYFFGWARLSSDKEQTWQMVILSIRLWDGADTTGPVSISQTTRKFAVLRFLNLYYDLPSPPPAMTVRLLGFLHPDILPPASRTETDRQAAAEEALLAEHYDTEYAQALLDHPLWGPDSADRRGWLHRTRTGAENVLTRGQKMAERVGVRSGVQADVGGGFYIVRD